MNVVSLPANMVVGTISSIGTALNPDNFMEYLTTDDYDKIKEYTTAMAITGRVAKNTYKNVKSEIKSYQTNKIMNSVNISNINYNKLGEIGNNYSLLNSPNYSLLNISGSLTQYGISSNIPKISLLRDNPYNGQTVAPYNPLLSGNISLYQSNAWNKNISLDKVYGYERQSVYSKNLVRIANRGTSAKYMPSNLKEQLALEQVKSNPLENSKVIIEKIKDSRWKDNGWEKKSSICEWSGCTLSL